MQLTIKSKDNKIDKRLLKNLAPKKTKDLIDDNILIEKSKIAVSSLFMNKMQGILDKDVNNIIYQ